jgi:SWI/SNF-related matrix-associated actin-dependent regulator 1 of chromatin subfamily A
MAKIDDFEKTYALINNYKGNNNQILYLKYKIGKGDYALSDFDVTYVLNNYDYQPYELNKTVKISSDYGEILQKKYELEFKPKKIRISRVIGEMGESLHCYVQYRKSIAPCLMYVKKKYILAPFENNEKQDDIIVDFDKYDEITKESGRKIKQAQKDGIQFLLQNKKCILADNMGTGKTLQSIIAAMETKCEKILIICPASLKSTWKREISIYNDPSTVAIINGSEWKKSEKYTIINYDILDNFYKIPTDIVYEEKIMEDGTKQKVPVMVKSSNGTLVPKTRKSLKKDKIKQCLKQSPLFLEHFDCVIIDEAHKLSNNTSIRYKVISDFIKRSNPQYVFLLTGTPLTNRPMNLYHILKLIDAEVTRDYQYYVKRYCDGEKIKLKTGKEITLSGGATNLDELKEKIKHVYIRRLLSDMTDMVNKSIVTRYYDLTATQMQRYEELWDEYVLAQQEQGNDDSEDYRQLVEGILVRQYLAKEMIPNTIQLVDEKLEDDEKVLIICTFTEEINELKKYYGDKCVVYDGKMTLKQKDKAEYEFMNNPKVKVFIGQIVACSVGLTLTAAHTLVFNSYSFSNAENKQAEDRIYRINQTNDVTCIYQLFNDSISQRMFDLVVRKQRIMDEVIKSENGKICS